MFWLAWPKSDYRGIARYIQPDAVAALLPATRGPDLLLEEAGYDRILQAIYQRVTEQSIQYAWDKPSHDHSVQSIRTIAEICDTPREGDCLDLALLFSAICLACELLPILVVMSDHAFIAVSRRYGLRDFNVRKRRMQEPLDHGLMSWQTLESLVASDAYHALDCTGCAIGFVGVGQAELRKAQGGVLTFEQALEVGRKQFERPEADFRFAADIATLHAIGFTPFSSAMLNLPAAISEALIDETSGRVRRALSASDKHEAVLRAMEAGLSAAVNHLTTQTIDPSLVRQSDRALTSFAHSQEVYEELVQLIEPQDGLEPDLDRLYRAFIEAGFSDNKATRAVFDGMMKDFIAAYYREAQHQEALQDVIALRMLHSLVERTSALAPAAARTADAAEQSAEFLALITTDVAEMRRDFHDLTQAISAASISTFDAYQLIASTLGQADILVDMDSEQGIYVRSDEVSLERRALLNQFQGLLRGFLREIEQNSRDPEYLKLLRQRYIALIIDQFAYLRLEGLTTDIKPIRLQLEDVYVHLRAVAHVPESADTFTPEEQRILRLLEESSQLRDEQKEQELREAYLHLDAIKRERWARERLERFPISKVLSDPQQRALVILGDPGSGKTTLLQFLALVFARGPEHVYKHLHLQGKDAERLPIFVPLASYDEMLKEINDLSIADFLGHYYARRRAASGFDQIFQAALDAGEALVLLDGLDEVTDESRRKYVAEQVGTFISTVVRTGNRVVLTSRIYGYRAAPISGNIPHVTVLDFGRQEIALFARQWFRAIAAWEHDGQLSPQQALLAQHKERQLLEDITSNPGVERLAVNPLLLTMLALLQRQVGSLPQRRIKLYDLYVNALIQTWETNRSRGARQQIEQRIDLKEAEGALITLALWMQQHRPSGTATKQDLLEQLTAFYLWEDEGLERALATPPQRRQAERRAEQFMHDMRHYSGLLVERGYNAFGFRHLTFQEYFAARALARMKSDERWNLLRPHLHSNRWREPILLAAARLGVSDNRNFEVTVLLEHILHADSDFEHILHRDLFLAADCAVDDIGVQPMLLRMIVSALQELIKSHIPALLEAAMRRLYLFTRLHVGDQLRLPDALEVLTLALPIDRLFSNYVSFNTYEREIFQKLLAEHAQLREEVTARLYAHSKDMRRAAMEALEPLLPEHPRICDQIAGFVNDPDSSIRQTAIRVLAPLLAEHEDLRQLIVRCVADRDWRVSQAAIKALAPLISKHYDLLDVIAARLESSNGWGRSAVIAAIAPVLDVYGDLRAQVLALLEDHGGFVRVAVVHALGPLAGNHSEVRSCLIKHLDDPDEEVRVLVVEHLSPLVAAFSELTQLLLMRFDDPDLDVRKAAVGGLSPLLIYDASLRAEFVRRLDGPAQLRGLLIKALAPLITRYPELSERILAYLGDPDEEIRAVVVQAITPLLSQHAQLRERVIALLEDEHWNVRRSVIQALSTIMISDRSARDHLQSALQHKDWRTRRNILAILPEHTLSSPNGIALVQHVWNNLDCEESAFARAAVIRALGPIIANDEQLYRLISTQIDDDDWHVRCAAIDALASRLPKSAQVRHQVARYLHDSDEDVRMTAVQALAAMLQHDKQLHEPIIACLKDTSWRVRQAAVNALAPLLPKQRNLRKYLLACLDDGDLDVLKTAMRAFAPLLPSSKSLRKRIAERLNDEAWDVRQTALQLLAPILSKDPAIYQQVIARLDDSDAFVREQAVSALAPFMQQRPDLRDLLVKRLYDNQEDVRVAAVWSLRPLLAQDKALRQRVMACLGDPSETVRAATIEVLAPWLSQDRLLAEQIVGRINDAAWVVRSAAIEAIRPLLRTQPCIRTQIVARLSDSAWGVRCTAISVLTAFVEEDSSLITKMLICLSDPNKAVKAAAIKAMAPILARKDEPDLYRYVLCCLDDTDVQVRLAAVEALISNLADDASLAERLLPVIASIHSPDAVMNMQRRQRFAQQLVDYLGSCVRANPQLRQAIIGHLSDLDWRMRAAAAQVVAAGGDAIVLEAKASLLAALHDHRGYDVLPSHIAAAERLLNHPLYSDQAIDKLLPALSYGLNAILPIRGAGEIRRSAALALGKLKALHRRSDVIEQIERLLSSERDLAVLDALFHALTSLAAAPEALETLMTEC